MSPPPRPLSCSAGARPSTASSTNRPRLLRDVSPPIPHDEPRDTAPTTVMRDSILTARQRQHERLTALVRRVALTCTDQEIYELEQLVKLVQAGELSARDAHDQIVSHQRQQRAAA